MPGYFTHRNSLNVWLILALLSGTAFLIYTYLKKQITNNIAQTILLTLRGKVIDVIANFALVQSAFETAEFTSDIYKQNNNLFGMKYAGQALAKGEKNGYAYYDSIEDSINDWAAWYKIARNQIFSLPLVINDLHDFVSFLKNRDYFESDEDAYYQGCLRYYNEYFNPATN